MESNSTGESPKSRKDALSSLPSFWEGGNEGVTRNPDDESDVTAELSVDTIRSAANATAADGSTDSTAKLDATTGSEDATRDLSSEYSAHTSTPAPAPQPTHAEETSTSANDAEPERIDVGEDFISTGAQPVMTPMSETKRGGRGGRVAIICVLALLLAVYVGVSVYFSSHFLPNTTVNGDDVSGMAIDDLAARITNSGMSYQTQVTGDGINLQISGKDIGVTYDGSSYAQAAAKQYSGWTWPVGIFQSRELKVDQGVAHNDELLIQTVSPVVEKINESATPPTNAGISYDAASGKFVETKDALGTQVNLDAVLASIRSGVQALHEQITLGDAELVQPTLRAGDKALNAGLEHANEIVTKSIPLQVAGADIMAIDGTLLSQWLNVNDKGEVSVNADAVKAWTQGDFSNRFDTVATKRTYTRPDGKVVEVEGGDLEYSYGWSVDGETLAQTITNNIQTNNFQPIAVPMLQEAARWNPGGQEWPNRYIDVDISEQTVRMYDNESNLIFEAPCVSGEPQYDGGTHRGVYHLYTKASPMELVGLDYNGDGQPDYRTNVTFWMPFDGGEGLHDMATRGAFGGDIYLYNGSHGCVNLPYSSAAELFDITEIGDVVIVHD